jgi:gluconolactonase
LEELLMSLALAPVARPETADPSAFLIHDDEFIDVIGPAPRLVHVVDVDAHEGPVYVPGEDALYFTSLPVVIDDPLPGTRRVAVKRLALDGDRFPLEASRVTVVHESANNANGMCLDGDARLIVCEQGSRTHPAAIGWIDPATGRHATVVDEWRGLRFNSPNDVVAKSDGTIWFTDPSYGHLQGFRPEPMVGDYVYRYDPATGRVAVVIDSFDKPNGLAFSPDESVLYVTDSGANQEAGSFHVDRPHHVLAFDVFPGGHLSGARLFAVVHPGFPDGIKVDRAGRVFTSAANGVHVFNPSGDLIGEIVLPGAINFTFGGPAGNVLFITTDTAVWAAVLSPSIGNLNTLHPQTQGA